MREVPEVIISLATSAAFSILVQKRTVFFVLGGCSFCCFFSHSCCFFPCSKNIEVYCFFWLPNLRCLFSACFANNAKIYRVFPPILVVFLTCCTKYFSLIMSSHLKLHLMSFTIFFVATTSGVFHGYSSDFFDLCRTSTVLLSSFFLIAAMCVQLSLRCTG